MVRCILAILATLALASSAFAKEYTYRRTEEQMKDLLQRIQVGAERFRNGVADALEKRGVNVATPQDNLYQYVSKLTQATSRLADRYSVGQTDSANVEQVLRWSVAIDGYLWRHHLTPQIEDDWRLLRNDLKELADAYHVPWGWLGPIGHAHRRSEIEMKALVDQMETRADSFRKSLDNALDKTRFNSTSAEDNVNQLVEDFEHATDRTQR